MFKAPPFVPKNVHIELPGEQRQQAKKSKEEDKEIDQLISKLGK